jgi:hypothetical protein
MENWCERYRRQGEQVWHEKISKEKAERRYKILRTMVDVQPGDRIVIPKMPTWGSFCIAVAKGPYEFEKETRLDPQDDDFRHIIPLQPEPKAIPHLSNADAQIIAASLNAYRKAANQVYAANVQGSMEAMIASKTTAVAGDLINLITQVQRAAIEKITRTYLKIA